MEKHPCWHTPRCGVRRTNARSMPLAADTGNGEFNFRRKARP
jgi:hypothetical protein